MLNLNQIIDKHLQKSKYNQIEIKENTFTFIVDEDIEEINILIDSFNGFETIIFNDLKYKVKEYANFPTYYIFYNLRLISFTLEEVN